VAVLTTDSIIIWYAKPCLPIISHRRSASSLNELGENILVQWRPDSSMVVVVTSRGHLIFYNLVVLTEVKTLYDQVDADNPSLRRESAELYFKDNVPPLVFSQAFEIAVPGGVTDLVCIRDELMVSTRTGHILRYQWDGQVNRDYCLDLRRIPFCVDQQVLRAVPLVDNAHVTHLSYSPLLGGFAIVLSDGRAAFLVAATLKFDPNSVQGIWAGGAEDVTCTALNHKYRLMAFGRTNSRGVVYCIDETTGGLVVSHHLVLPTKDYPGCPGPVTSLRWTPDSTCLALAWAGGGFSIWSTFGTMILCSLGWDHGPLITNTMKQTAYNIMAMDWSAEGYQLWMVNSSRKLYTAAKDKEFCPFPEDRVEDDEKDPRSHLGDTVLVMPFVKSPLTVNPAMSVSDQLYLQGEDRLYLNSGECPTLATPPPTLHQDDVWEPATSPPTQPNSNPQSASSKQWSIISIPYAYISSSWPIRYTAVDESASWVAVAGRTGVAHYSTASRKWRLFGNESQERGFIVTGGLLWWKEFLVIGCFNIATNRDEVRLYPREARLDNAWCRVEPVDAQVLLLNRLNDRLVVYCANSHISLFELSTDASQPLMAALTKVQDVDASALSIHPACVVSITLTHLKTETSRHHRDSGRDSSDRDESVESASIIMNVCGKLIMIQRDIRADGDDSDLLYSAPTVLAGQCEQVWLPGQANLSKPHLTLALWLYCGAAGMKVWLPLFPNEDESQRTFMARRIMLHFPLDNIYPLAILFEAAIILGAENDTVLYSGPKEGPAALPYCTLERTSEVYLQQLLRQLIRRNLGHHAWEIARTCSGLPYFQHSLELLLHTVLEEEATSKDPIPDALLPSIVEFIRSFPVFRETVVRCARKTEVALWPYLFAAVGSARVLFTDCLENDELSTAASYLIILQSLEPPSAARQHAAQLLDHALDSADWELSQELTRFLRAIDPEECEDMYSAPRTLSGLSSTLPFSPMSPSGTAGEEDLSLVLGTLVVPRSRSISTSHPPKPVSPQTPHELLSRSVSDKNATPHSGGKTRRISTSSSLNNSKDGTAEEFFIDMILARHARKLLAAGRLADLGRFAAHLDFHLVAWLRRESARAGQVMDFVWALKRVHQDFGWPFPTGGGASSGSDSARSRASSHHSCPPALDDKFRTLYIDVNGDNPPPKPADSGFVSNSTDRQISELSLPSLLSEQTVDAMLRVRDRQAPDQLSVLSEDHDMTSMCGAASPVVDTPPWQLDFPSAEGPPKAEVQLRYMLQLLVEAGCLDWAAVAAAVLRDAMAIIRIVNAARSSPEAGDVVAGLHHGFVQIENYAQTTCQGYRVFLNAIQPQLRSLSKFLVTSGVQSESHPSPANPTPSPATPKQIRRQMSAPEVSPHFRTQVTQSHSPQLQHREPEVEAVNPGEEDPSACVLS